MHCWGSIPRSGREYAPLPGSKGQSKDRVQPRIPAKATTNYLVVAVVLVAGQLVRKGIGAV